MVRLEHIGIAATDPDRAAALYEALFGVRPYKSETVEREGVRTHFVSVDSAKLELLEALHDESPIAKYLEKRGQGLHHLAFEVDDIDAAYGRLALAGFRLLHPEPKPGADGKRIFFIHPKQTEGVLIELCASTPTPLTAVLIETAAGDVAVYECGDFRNPALVVLHDLGASTSEETELLVRKLEQHFHILAIDFPGHGLSPTLDSAPSVSTYVHTLKNVLDHFALRRVGLFGVAQGGSIGLALASEHPTYVDRLSIYNPDPLFVPGTGPTGGDGAPMAQLTPAILRNIESHTLLSAHTEKPIEDLMALYRHIPDASLCVLPDAGPRLQTVDLEIYSRILRRWFS